MSAARKQFLPKMFDLPLLVAAALTVGFYVLLSQEALKHSMLAHYTTEHTVEYVIVGFFIWGLVDVAFHALGFPSEMLAMKQNWLPSRSAREPVSHAAALVVALQKKPRWLHDSRVGQRFIRALTYLKEKGSASEFGEHLRYLAELDEEDAHGSYSLVRFICWVTPMLGFLGTVVHFGTALGGQAAGEIGDKLPTVVAEMGTAFNTTTVALIAATTMMFCLFLCERTERSILHTIDRRVERELLHRFEAADSSLEPFLGALEVAGRANLDAMDAMLQRQLEVWTGAFTSLAQQAEKRQQIQSQLWEQTLAEAHQRFIAGEAERQNRLERVLEAMTDTREAHRAEVSQTVHQVATLQADFSRLVESLSGLVETKGEVVKLQAVLADNLRLLRESSQMDQALHELTGAIHLLTARSHSSAFKDRAA